MIKCICIIYTMCKKTGLRKLVVIQSNLNRIAVFFTVTIFTTPSICSCRRTQVLNKWKYYWLNLKKMFTLMQLMLKCPPPPSLAYMLLNFSRSMTIQLKLNINGLHYLGHNQAACIPVACSRCWPAWAWRVFIIFTMQFVSVSEVLFSQGIAATDLRYGEICYVSFFKCHNVFLQFKKSQNEGTTLI